MLKLFIHAGTAKTGTSAIQAFLNYNREILFRQYSCLYPNFNSYPIHRGYDGHNHCKHIKTPEVSTVSKDLGDAITFCKKNNISTIIISCEGFFSRPDMIHHLVKDLKTDPDLSIYLIVFFRRQDHFFESGWKQWGSKNIQYASINEYISNMTIRWLDNLMIYENLLGKENIIAYPYEKEQLSDGLICKFLDIVGIRYHERQWVIPPESNVNLNYGFNRDILEILSLNKSFYKNIHDNTLLNFFYRTLPEAYQKKPYEKYDLLSPRERREILEKYEGMNQAIARKYLGREDGKLFFEPWPDPDDPWTPYEGLTVEKILPVFVQMMYYLDKRYNTENTVRKEKSIRKRIENFCLRITNLIHR